jgi:hypothetical protein
MATAIWHGTFKERRELSNAMRHNCACEFGRMGVRFSTCAGHHMLNEDQRALDGLLFARRIAGRLRHEEGLDIYQRRIQSSPRLFAVPPDGQKPSSRNTHWGWASVALGYDRGIA